jgi:hypothetical protein
MNRLFTSARASRHLKYGAPFFLFLFGGNYALRQFRSVRYDTDINPKAAQYGKAGGGLYIDRGSRSGRIRIMMPDPVLQPVPDEDSDRTGSYLFDVQFSIIFAKFYYKTI